MYLTVICLYLAASVLGQRPGNVIPENAVSMPMQTCTKSGCTKESTKVVLDANWRWVHTNSGYTNCYNGNQWDPKYCPDGKKCVQNCVLEGADYQKTYGISSPSSGSLKLNFVTNTPNGKTVGSRVYLLAPTNNYRMFNLLNREFSFDVDISNLPCGVNGALYFSQMDADGGMARYPGNKAGAKYGTGYCDAQCPQDIKFINGEANVNNWNRNSGFGNFGSCCPEMDIWEANSDSTAFTPHPCRTLGQSRCSGNSKCGAGNSRYNNVCDRDGCDFNPYRVGNQNFFGPGKQVDTRRPFTVVTQFITSNGQDNGQLKEIRRLYVQNGKVIQNIKTNIKGVSATNAISDTYCKKVKSAFGDRNYFSEVGGMGRMGQALRNMVLVLSVWDDHVAGMKWLDSRYPDNASPSKAGVMRGRCSPSSGNPGTLESQYPGSSVTYSNIKVGARGSLRLLDLPLTAQQFGTIGSTYKS